jgi:uncharacterized membrane protein
VKWLAPSILAAAGAWLAIRWDDLPNRWPSHWGLSGQADGFATKTPLGVFGLLLVGAFICLVFEGLLQATRKKSSVQSSSIALGLRIVETSLAVVLAGASLWLPLSRPASPFGFVVFTIIVMGLGLAAAITLSVREVKRLTLSGAEKDGWLGLIYRNPYDDRLWVPKRLGTGLTLNFAHRHAWPTLLVLIAPAILILLTVAVLTLIRR